MGSPSQRAGVSNASGGIRSQPAANIWRKVCIRNTADERWLAEENILGPGTNV